MDERSGDGVIEHGLKGKGKGEERKEPWEGQQDHGPQLECK